MKRNRSLREGLSCRLSVAALAALLFCALAASGEDIPPAGASSGGSLPDMPFLLLQIQADVQGSLNDLEAAVADASAELSAPGLGGHAARQVLGRLLDANPDLVEAVTFDIDGRIVVAECDDCEGAEGADIGGQEHIARVLKTRNPAFSGEFVLV
jgi:polar amino acid transport system substrate-binding protein